MKHHLLASLIALGYSQSGAAADIQWTLLEQVEPSPLGEPGVGAPSEDAPADDLDALPFAKDLVADPERRPVASEGDESPFGDDPLPAPEAFSAERMSPDGCCHGDACDACGDSQVAQEGVCCHGGADSPCQTIWDEPRCCGDHAQRIWDDIWDAWAPGCDHADDIWDEPAACCDHPAHLWAKIDYLHWWVQGYAVPALVTAAPSGNSGLLDNPEVMVLMGRDRLNSGDRPGGRGRIGWWFDCCETRGIQVEFLGLEHGGTRLDLVSSPGAMLYRPFFAMDPSDNGPEVHPADRIEVASASRLYAGHVLYRQNWKCGFEPCGCRAYRIDLLAGYRHLRLDEALIIRDTARLNSTSRGITDRFAADNQFHGGELGLVGNFHRGDWSLELLAKVALGNNHQTVTVQGEEVTTVDGLSPRLRSDGLLARPTNIRSESRDAFAVLPEASAELGYLLTDNLRLTVGYTILWLNHAVRPGDQIDSLIDARFLNSNLVPPLTPPATRPAPRFIESSLWAQGMHFGLEWRY